MYGSKSPLPTLSINQNNHQEFPCDVTMTPYPSKQKKNTKMSEFVLNHKKKKERPILTGSATKVL